MQGILKKLEKQESELLSEFNKVSNELNKIQYAIDKAREKEKMEKKVGVRVGSVVKGSEGEYRVTSVDTKGHENCPWLKGDLKQKDGIYRTETKSLFSNWELISF